MITQLPPLNRKALSALLALLICWLPVAAQQAVPAPAHTFILTPTEIPAGKISRLTLTLNGGANLVSTTAPDIAIKALDPAALTVLSQSLTPDKKRLLLTVEAPEASLGRTTLSISAGNKANAPLPEIDGVDLTVTEFKQRALDQKPTPNGITRVDAMWTLLPDSVVKDNYGRSTAKNYYGIQVVIGNNSGFDMQVVGMGFVTRLWPKGGDSQHAHAAATEYFDEPCIEPAATATSQPDDATKPDKAHPPSYGSGCVQIPALDHRLVRGTIEKEQVFGKRAKTLGLLTGVGTLSTGFLPFFRAANPKANFSTLTSVLNGQFKEGFNLAVPDLTVRQLNRLENQVMHDELTISNNGQERTVIFVPKGLFDRLDESGKKIEKRIMLPAEVTRRLGELILVGRPLLYFEDRQIVVAKTERTSLASEPRNISEEKPPPPPPPVTVATPPSAPALTLSSITPNSGALDDTHEVILTGTGFTPGSSVTLKFGDVPTKGSAISATKVEAIAPMQTTAGAVNVTLTTADNRTVTLSGGYVYLDKLTLSPPEPMTAPAAGGALITIRGRGFIDGARVQIGGIQATVVNFAADHNAITVILPAHASGTVDIVVINPNNKTATLAKAFTHP